MKFDQLKAFHRVALTGSFTKAAKSLHLTQPAVSKQIQLLEHSLGIRLFDRQGKKVRLTNEGNTLIAYTDRLFNLYGEILALFESEQSMEHGKIAIGSSNVMGTYYLPNIIRLYNNKYPGIEIDLRLGNSDYVIDKILEGEVDIGIAGKAGNHSKLSRQLIHKEPLLLVSSIPLTFGTANTEPTDIHKIPL
ncbi:LysR family transcriptional regulator [Patescibacteria group bacterium]|nr:LysR family transcriptional regulator [Patescibacteria group bacterium]